MSDKLHLTTDGFNLILSYKASFTKKLTASVFTSELYNCITPYNIKNIVINESLILNPHYVTGFVAADGSFSITKPSLSGR